MPAPGSTPAPGRLVLPLEPGERWFGGDVRDGRHLPFGTAPFTRRLAAPGGTDHDPGEASNQAAPLLVSTAGRIVWSDHPFEFRIVDGSLEVTGDGLVATRGGTTLREAFLAASARYFPPSGATPDLRMFTAPQYNTWIHQPHRPTADGVLEYARRLLDSGMPPGVLMIDDNWALDYGTWRFDRARFPDARAMVETLHGWGFAVMLWLVPFVSPDSPTFRRLERDGLLLRDGDGRTAIRRWWNGFSALLDPSNPAAVAWLTGELDALMRETGVDGFKFDGGDVRDYRPDDRAAATPAGQCEAWARIGLRYPMNEYRACWRLGGHPLAQRLHDKPPSWGPDGLGSLIPELLAQGMIGHPYGCPDMIGGGEISAMTGHAVDQEFFVRYAQVAALAPMAQFSLVPADVLDAEHLAAVHDALAVRAAHLGLLLDLVAHAAATGEPVLRPMAYHAPDLADVVDQFFLGPDLVVAPVLERAATARSVRVPAGAWRTPDGTVVTGPALLEYPVGLGTIPRLARVP